MFEKFNKTTNSIREGIKVEDLEFAPLSDFINKEVKVDGFFFTKGEYGEQVVVIGENYKINMPKRAVEQFREIYENEDMLNALLDGHLKLTNIKSLKTKKGMTIAYTFTDC